MARPKTEGLSLYRTELLPPSLPLSLQTHTHIWDKIPQHQVKTYTKSYPLKQTNPMAKTV